METASDHTSFQLSGIPAVLLMQRGRGYLYHSAADTAEQLDLYAIAAAADSAAAAAEEICSADTPSYRAPAREQGRERRLPPDQTEYDLFRQFQSGY